MQNWLAIPSAGAQTEDELVGALGSDETQCTDLQFPPAAKSLYDDPDNPPASAPRDADWKRVHGMLYVPTSQALKILPVRSTYVVAS